MESLRWTATTTLLACALWLLASSATPAAAVRISAPDPELAELEARVAKHPGDSEALLSLTESYLTLGEPGLAHAALTRAPHSVQHEPMIEDARARVLGGLGQTAKALAVQRAMLEQCRSLPCSRPFVARARQRERIYDHMVRMGIEDPREQPARAELAYQRAVRVVSLDLK